MKITWKNVPSKGIVRPASQTPRRPQKLGFSWDRLEERAVMSHLGGFSQLDQAAVSTFNDIDAYNDAPMSTTVGTISANIETDYETPTGSTTASQTALTTLQTDIQKIQAASGTTVGQLTAIETSFQTLNADGLNPTSQLALSTFEDSLVAAKASGTTLAGNATLLGQFKALYTTTPTAQQATDLTSAYNALAATVTSSNITAANITTINTDYAAVLAAQGSTSTATFPYFSLVTDGTYEGFGNDYGRGERD